VVNDNWDEFCFDYTVIKAAGGIVFNEKDELLMIYRNGKWDLPKGKKEFNENDEECALREVCEECGVENLSIVNFYETTYHTYEQNGEKILKITKWFIMNSVGDHNLSPQLSEGIEKAMWIKKSNLDKNLKNSFGNIVEILKNI